MTGIILGIGNSAALFAPKGTPFDPKDVIELVDPEQPHVSVFDLSVLRGDGIFEATTVWKGFPVSLENHLRRLATSAAMTDLPEPNIDAFTAAVNTVIAAYDDPEPGPMLRILVSRGYDPTTGVGAGKGRLPSVWIFLDGKGLLHSLEPLTMISLSRGYASDVTAKAPWLLNGAKTLSYASPSIGCATVAASAIRSSTRPTGSRSNARIRRSSASTAIRSLHPTRASASSTAPRSANCSRGRSKRARRSNTASCRWPNCAKPTICS